MTSAITSKMFVTFFLLIFFMNYNAEAGSNFEIFSIVSDNALQRKTLYSRGLFGDNTTDAENLKNLQKRRLMQYLSLMSDEITEVEKFNDKKFQPHSLLLQSAHIQLFTDEVLFHDMVYEDFANFKKSKVRLETIIPDGLDPNTVKIIYEATDIPHIVFSGFGKINGTDYNVALNLTGSSLKAEYERTPSATGERIITKSVRETFAFEKFALLIELFDGNKMLESPHQPLLRRLADTWLVNVVGAVNGRFLQPKIVEQSRSFFNAYKNRLVKGVCSSIARAPIDSTSNLPDWNMMGTDYDEYNRYSFENINFSNYKKFENCTCNSWTIRLEKNGCPVDSFYSHNMAFVFAYSSAASKTDQRPSIGWTMKKIRDEGSRNRYGEYRDVKTAVDNYLGAVNYWTVQLTVLTDKNGRKTDDGVRANVNFGLENDPNLTISNCYVNRFLDLFEKSVAKVVKSHVESNLF